MHTSLKQTRWVVAASLTLACCASISEAQVVPQPEPAPVPQPLVPFSPQPGISYYVPPPPPFLRPTQYSFNGPSSATVTYLTTTTTHYQPGPGGNRLMTTNFYTPIHGYIPGYYSGYYTPLFFRP